MTGKRRRLGLLATSGGDLFAVGASVGDPLMFVRRIPSTKVSEELRSMRGVVGLPTGAMALATVAVRHKPFSNVPTEAGLPREIPGQPQGLPLRPIDDLAFHACNMDGNVTTLHREGRHCLDLQSTASTVVLWLSAIRQRVIIEFSKDHAALSAAIAADFFGCGGFCGGLIRRAKPGNNRRTAPKPT